MAVKWQRHFVDGATRRSHARRRVETDVAGVVDNAALVSVPDEPHPDVRRRVTVQPAAASASRRCVGAGRPRPDLAGPGRTRPHSPADPRLRADNADWRLMSTPRWSPRTARMSRRRRLTSGVGATTRCWRCWTEPVDPWRGFSGWATPARTPPPLASRYRMWRWVQVHDAHRSGQPIRIRARDAEATKAWLVHQHRRSSRTGTGWTARSGSP